MLFVDYFDLRGTCRSHLGDTQPEGVDSFALGQSNDGESKGGGRGGDLTRGAGLPGVEGRVASSVGPSGRRFGLCLVIGSTLGFGVGVLWRRCRRGREGEGGVSLLVSRLLEIGFGRVMGVW